MKSFMTCLHFLIVPNWQLEFHVHIDASNYALGIVLGQNPNNIIDPPIYYVN
jgi:hypothetical protein